MLKDDLDSQINYKLDCSSEELNLQIYEYITEIKFEFNTVEAGFTQVKSPKFSCRVKSSLPDEYIFTNCADVGGQRYDEWIIAKDCVTTVVYDGPRGKLPQTGL